MPWRKLESAPETGSFLILDRDIDGNYIVRQGERSDRGFVTYDDEISTDPIAWYELPAETPDRFSPLHRDQLHIY